MPLVRGLEELLAQAGTLRKRGPLPNPLLLLTRNPLSSQFLDVSAPKDIKVFVLGDHPVAALLSLALQKGGHGYVVLLEG